MASLNDYLDPMPSDAGNNSSILYIGASASLDVQNRTALGSTPKQLLHVKIEISNCNAGPQLSFTDLAFMELFASYATSSNDTNLSSYSAIIASDTENSDLCVMEITGFSTFLPSDIANAGVSQLAIIHGNNLLGADGEYGTIEMKSADDDGLEWIALNDFDISSWTNTEVSFYPPSTLFPEGDGTIESGKIRLTNSDQEIVISEDELIVGYSRMNAPLFIADNSYKVKTILAGFDLVPDEDGHNPQTGYLFKTEASFLSNSPAVDAFKTALKAWTCSSEIR